MKKIAAVMLFAGSISCLHAQNYRYADSLKKELYQNHDMATLLPLSYFYLEINLDSSMKYAQRAYQLSLEKNTPELEAWALNMTGAILWRSGNTDKSLESLLRALKMFEEQNDSSGLSTVYISLGTLYFSHNDYGKAMNYLYSSLEVVPVKPSPSAPADLSRLTGDFQKSLTLGILGNIYVNIKKLDSALYFTQQSYEIYRRMNDKKYLPITLNLLGFIHQQSGNTGLAREFYKLGVKESFANGNLTQACNIYMSIANSFKESNMIDSSFYYAAKAFAVAQQVRSPYTIGQSAEFLMDYYKHRNMLDSAFTYQEIVTSAKDSLLGLEKLKQVQSLSFHEQLRQQEMIAQSILEKEKRKHNLQLMGIAVFIPAFFGVVLLLSRRKVKSRTVEFLGLLALLLLFEFISLFIHPYIATWTHETPVYMLLILVAVAALLVPIHHSLQNWMQQKLAFKPAAVSQTPMIEFPVVTEDPHDSIINQERY
jgi:tetratricopeptide (TPR) repeat protein